MHDPRQAEPLHVRPAAIDDAASIEPLASWMQARGTVALVVEHADRIVLAGGLFQHGAGPEPHTPHLRFARPADTPAAAPGLRESMPPLVDALLHAARSSSHTRVIAMWDPMEPIGLRVLESHGFRPTGAMPYFDLGGGNVQYVTGYADATGSTLDLALELS